MIDQQKTDQKVLAVPNRNPRYDQVQNMDQIFAHVRREIEHFFTIYKELEGRATSTLGWKDVNEARHVIREYWNTYLKRKPDH
jgi:inorganic pyrophosphatase